VVGNPIMDKETFRVLDQFGLLKEVVYQRKYNADLKTLVGTGGYEDTLAIKSPTPSDAK
jgi:hypothetical protein